MLLYFAGVRRQLGFHGEGAAGDGVSVVGHVDGVDPLLGGRVTEQADVCFTRLTLHFTGHRALAGAQLQAQTQTVDKAQPRAGDPNEKHLTLTTATSS